MVLDLFTCLLIFLLWHRLSPYGMIYDVIPISPLPSLLWHCCSPHLLLLTLRLCWTVRPGTGLGFPPSMPKWASCPTLGLLYVVYVMCCKFAQTYNIPNPSRRLAFFLVSVYARPVADFALGRRAPYFDICIDGLYSVHNINTKWGIKPKARKPRANQQESVESKTSGPLVCLALTQTRITRSAAGIGKMSWLHCSWG